MRGGLSAERLARTLRTDPLQVEPLLDTLVALDWVGRLEEPGAARYVLLCDPGSTLAQPLIGQLLLEPTPALTAFRLRARFDVLTLADLVAR